MDFRHGAFVVLALVTVGGCRARLNQELLERELRIQEDTIWDLKSQLEECRMNRDAKDARGASPAKTDDDASPEAILTPERTGSGDLPGSGPLPSIDLTVPPVIELPSTLPVPKYEGPPEIMRPDPSIPEGQLPPPASTPNPLPTQTPPPSPPAALPDADAPPAPPDEARRHSGPMVDSITLNRHLTGGYNADGVPGDEGIAVVVEPRDASGKLVGAPGTISIAVLDPALPGEQSRVARWDFAADEAAEHLHTTAQGSAMHFELQWPDKPPAHRSLKLFVRFTTDDGRKLLADKQIDVEPAAGQARQWTRASQPLPTPAPLGGQPPRRPAPAETPEQTPPPARWNPYR